MGLRESVATSLHSTHLESREEECPIDRIGSLARATDLGRALWRYGYAGDETSAKSAFRHLLRKAQRRTKVYRHSREFSILEKVCAMVMAEWKNQACRRCNGAGAIEDHKLTVVCPACGGIGKHRYSDSERMSAMGVEPSRYAKWERHVAEVWFCIAGADDSASFTVREQLRG